MVMVRRILLGLALVGSAAAFTGCGVKSTLDPVAAAATKTESTGGEKIAMTFGINADGRSFSVSANGFASQDQADITMDLSSALAAAGVPGSNGSVEIRYLQENGDPVMYLNAPFLSSRLPGGASWVRLDLEKAGQTVGVDVNQMLGQATQNPADVLDLLRSTGTVDEVGSDTIDGVATTEYKATIDLDKAAANLGSQAQSLVDQLVAQGAPSQIPVNVWIGNDDNLVHQLTMDESISAGGHTGDVQLQLDLSDYGTGATVSAPPADQVFDLTGLASAAAGVLH
jgi:hypothetical protein